MLVAVQVTGDLPLMAAKPPVGAPAACAVAQPIRPSSAALPVAPDDAGVVVPEPGDVVVVVVVVEVPDVVPLELSLVPLLLALLLLPPPHATSTPLDSTMHQIRAAPNRPIARVIRCSPLCSTNFVWRARTVRAASHAPISTPRNARNLSRRDQTRAMTAGVE
jgi:hypothetical protein